MSYYNHSSSTQSRYTVHSSKLSLSKTTPSISLPFSLSTPLPSAFRSLSINTNQVFNSLNIININLYIHEIEIEIEIKRNKAMATNSNPSASSNPSVYLQDIDQVKKVFNRFDANSDGKISVTELTDVMKALGSDTSAEEVSKMMTEIDTDKDGFINLEEFADFCKGSLSADGGDDDGGVKELKDAFELYDQDKNGLISASELHLILSRLGEGCSVQDCSKMIKSFDSDGDGFVSFEEFKKMMTNNATANSGSK